MKNLELIHLTNMEANSLAPKLRFKEFNSDWESRRLNDIANFFNSQRVPLTSSDREKGPFPYYGASGIIDYVKDFIFEGEYVLLGEDGANIITRSTRLVYIAKGKFWVNNHAHIFQANGSNIFLCEALERINYSKYNSGTAQPKLNSDVLKKINLFVPKVEEQNKIASFLTSVDKKINLLTKKKALIESYKKGVMQKIFSQEIRFKDEDGKDFPNWESKRLREYLVKHTEKSTVNNQYPVLTSSRKGLFFQKDYFNGQNVASKDNTGYNVVPRGYFTYRHMSDDLDFKFNINHLCDRGIVSTLYPVFKTDEKLDDYFLLNKLNNGEEFKRYALLQKQGGSRTYMYFNKLEFLKLFIPHLKEQQKIVSFLSKISKKIELVDFQLERNKEFKKGLLQQMFV